MNRRWIAAGVALVLPFPVFALSGCESLQTRKAQHAADQGEEKDEVLDVQSETPKSFFKSSRLSGALSDEGRDIEKDLGIH